MSEVYSFRLSDQNLREAQAKGVLEAWVKQGYCLRHILTEALLLLDKQENHSSQMDDIAETVDRLSRLVERLEGRFETVQTCSKVKSDLSESFLSAIKLTAKPGIRINNE